MIEPQFLQLWLHSYSAYSQCSFLSCSVGDELPKELLFDESTTEIQVNITIKDDDIFEELLETFTVSLVRDPVDPVDEVVVDPDAATVFIRDGEFMG